MDVNEIYQLIQYVSNKNQQGFITPSQFNTVINQAQKSYTSYLLGSFQQYTPGRPVARVQLGQNSVLRQRLAPIITQGSLTIDPTGFSPYPGDYLQTDAMRTNTFERIRFVQQDSLYSYYNSAIDPVATNPIYLIEDVGFRFYPINLGSAKISYVSDPPDMIWAYTLDANNRPVYDALASTQPVWDVASILDIISRALAMIGVNLQAGMISQYAQEIKVNGQ
jgi:hypothetical protein